MRMRAALLGSVVLLAAAPGARAAPPWLKPATIAGVARAEFPQVVFTRAGVAVVVANKIRPGRNAPIVGAVQARGATTFRRARQLAPGDFEGGTDFGAFAPLRGSGVVALISRVHVGLQATIRPWLATGAPGRRLRLRQQLGAPGTFSLVRGVASNRRGDVAGVYITCNSRCSRQRVTLAAWPAGARRAHLRSIAALPANGQDYVQAAVALDARGRLVVAYGNRRLVGVRRGTVRGRLGRAQRLARVSRPVTAITAAISDAGAALVGWAAQGVAATAPARFGAAVAPSARRRFRPRALERWPGGANESVRGTPIRAVAAGGRLSLGWTGAERGLYVTRLADVVGGAVGAPQTLTAPGLDVELSDLAAAPSGRAIAVLQVADPNRSRSAVYASERPAGAAASGALIRVSDGSRQVGGARVALDPGGGRAVAAWLEGRTPLLRAATLP
ncbi:MAG TPA: hypothetical protein VH418_06065 [Solirubrobacteraceae bacterium]|jgi:hypothetical protein